MYPRLVYKSASIYMLVETPEAHAQAINGEWFDSVPEALEGKKPAKVEAEQDDNSPPTRAELEAKATELGLKFDGRTSDAKLGKLIDEALKD